MKRRINFALIIALAALLVLALAACNPTPGNPFLPEDPTISTYTVTFDTNGADISSDSLPSEIKGVKYGDTIPEPKTADGQSIVLQKKGYIFDGWTVNNTEFKFDSTPIQGPTTIKAKFTAKKYYHVIDLGGTLAYDEETDSFAINPYGHATLSGGNPDLTSTLTDSLGNPVLDANGDPTLAPATDISLPTEEIGESTRLYSTYNTTSPSAYPVPTRESEDKFCFWYYLADELDENGDPVLGADNNPKQRPVQFTEWASDGATTVAVRSVTYSVDDRLHLYAMFESDLPKVTIEYYEDYSENKEDLNLLDGSHSYVLGKTIDEKDKFVPNPAATKAHQANFEFDHWYFVYFTESEDDEDEMVRNIQKFVFDTFDENGKSTNKNATSPMDAAHRDDIPVAEQNFRPLTLRLYANWVKKIEISSVEEFTTLRDAINACYDNPDKRAELDEYLTAQINFTKDIDFGNREISPLFGRKDAPFTGTIEGGIYDVNDDTGEKTLSRRIKLSSAKVVGDANASLFGYVNGTIQNLSVEKCFFKTTNSSEAVYLGTLASVCGGKISGCYVTGSTFEIAPDSALAYIGGLAGSLTGTANDADKGSINECYVQASLPSETTVKRLSLGGAVGESGSSTAFANVTASLTVANLTVSGEQGYYSGLRIGGLLGNGASSVTACEATLTLAQVEAKGSALIGGLAGQNASAIARSFATFDIAEGGSVKVGARYSLQTVALGGLVGLNEGELINSYSVVNLRAVSVAGNRSVMVGGLVGSNSSGRGDSQSDQEKGAGAINRCYSTGNITVTASEDASAQLYAGGMIGFSKHSKFARNFTLVNINITYQTQKASELIHAGFIFGELDKSAAITSGYYALENRISINGTEYAPKQETTEGEEQGQTPAEPENDAVYRLGTPRPASDFADKSIVFGTNSDQQHLGWIGGNEEEPSKNIWEFKQDATLPTLVNAGTTL